MKEESASFLKKRSKKLLRLCLRLARDIAGQMRKLHHKSFLVLFFKKELLACFICLLCTGAAGEPPITLPQALGLLHGRFAVAGGPMHLAPLPQGALIGAGYVPGVPALGVAALRESDAGLGVAFVMGLRKDGATALPSGLAMAASFSPDMAAQAGAMIGREARAKGFDVLLAGGVDLARDPRNGRNFEYAGEDPLLAGRMVGAAIKGIQDQHIVSTIKHFALNDLESGRSFHDAVIGEPAARESDLLAFEIALEQGRPGAVMCAYNRVNGAYACENSWLLNDVLKHDWHYPGWVMSDWGAVHGVDALMAGLDQESGEQFDAQVWFGAPLAALAAGNAAVRARVFDAAGRIVSTLRRIGVSDHPAEHIDFAADAAVSQASAEAGMVLLRNEGGVLPLSKDRVRRIAVIGGHADFGVLSGGGSSQVVGPQGAALAEKLGGGAPFDAAFRTAFFNGSSPLSAIRAMVPRARVTFTASRYASEAAEAARGADVAIVFATQWEGEGEDLPDLSLPDGQDAVIASVAAANPRTIVVLETGNPVLMPWRDRVAGVLEAWYSGARGGEAIARVLFGDVTPGGRLPITFPASLAQTPRPRRPGLGAAADAAFKVVYSEGSDVGYRWMAARHLAPLYPFGFGLSFTKFRLSGLRVLPGDTPRFSVTVRNTGKVAGADTPQIYLVSAPGRRQERLLGWGRVALRPGETREVSVQTDPRLLANWDEAGHGWVVAGGMYQVAAGESAADLRLRATMTQPMRSLPP
jgi:beta-glucosidase